MAEGEPQQKRNPGRRGADYVRQKSVWVLVAGVLLQGGFLTMSWRLLAIGERQLDRERALLVEQHQELLGAVADLGRRVDALEARAGELAEAASTVRGMVLGRSKCPDLTCPRCPACPPPPPGPIIVTAPASAAPLLSPERPPGDGKKQASEPRKRREP